MLCLNSLKCISNAIGLTIGKKYEILKEGKYWFKVKNDNNELVHYSKDNFENGKPKYYGLIPKVSWKKSGNFDQSILKRLEDISAWLLKINW